MTIRIMMMAAMAATGGTATVPASMPVRPITIARIGSAIDDATVIGPRRAGALCLPNGSIHWSDIGGGTSMDQRAVVQDAFEDADVPVTPLGIGPDHAARLRGTVQAAHVALCARRFLGDRNALSGDATLRIEWRLESADGGPVRSHVSDVARTFDAKHAAPLGSLYRLMLVDAAKDAAAWLKAGAGPALAADAGQ